MITKIKISLCLMLFSCTSCFNRSEDEIHLIPKDFKGVVVIRFSMPNGKYKVFENNKRLYSIPSNGVLDTKFDSNDGYRDVHFFLLKNDKKILIDSSSSVKIEGLQIGSSISDITGEKITFMTYLVGTKADMDSLYIARERMNEADYLQK